MKVTEVNHKSRFEKLIRGLIEGEDVTNFSVDFDANPKRIQILVGDYNVELLENGKWEII